MLSQWHVHSLSIWTGVYQHHISVYYTYSAVQFISEAEVDQNFHFFIVNLQRQNNGSILSNIWISIALYCWSKSETWCVALQRKICTKETLADELMNTVNVPRNNGFPDRFIAKNLNHQQIFYPLFVVDRKPIFIRLPFRRDVITDRSNRWLH